MACQYRRDFGSFHASNVQELLSIDEDSYVPPELPFPLVNFTEYVTNGPPNFGRYTRDKHFCLEECIFINHGAFGAVLKEALEMAQAWQLYIEKQPVRFMDRELFPHLVHVTRRLAKFVGCDPLDLVLVQNATTALSAVILSQEFQPDDSIYYFNTSYGSVKKMLYYLRDTKGIVIQEEKLPCSGSDIEQITDLLRNTLSANTKLAIFDHIPSAVPIIMPLHQMIQICHEKNIPVLVDGSHALGVLPLNLASLNADFYVSNAHKWLSSPKGCGFLYTRRDLQKSIRSRIISHGFDYGFNSEFLWTGLRDFSSLLSLHTVLDFWDSVGYDAIYSYCHGLLKSAVNVLQVTWKTEAFTSVINFGFMGLIQLPEELYKHLPQVTYKDAEQVQNKLYQVGIEVPVKVWENKLFVRISCHIYNELWEYWKLAKAVSEIGSKMSQSINGSEDLKDCFGSDINHLEELSISNKKEGDNEITTNGNECLGIRPGMNNSEEI